MTPNEAYQLALSDVQKGKLGRYETPSQTSYVVDPTDGTLWDLKPVLGITLERLGIDVSRGLGTQALVSLCREQNVAFELVVFKCRMARPLGLRSDEEGLAEVNWTELRENFSERTPCASFRYVKVYNRSPKIIELALAKAKGICSACQMPAPFTSLKGDPFLEVHHIVPLSSGGHDTPENVVALCPNCHRKQHVGQPDTFG